VRGTIPGLRQRLAGSEVAHPQAVIAECGDEQPPAPCIDREVVDAAAHFAKRDLRFEHERRDGSLRHRR
jgi:hypothetical protein